MIEKSDVYISKDNKDRIVIGKKDSKDELEVAIFYKVITKMTNKKKIYYEGELYRKSPNRAGFDIVQHESIYVPPRTTVKIKTNVRFPYGIDDNFALVTLRSSYQGSGLIMPAVGILDSDYVDYLFITVFNSSYQSVKINKGDRFVQLVFIKNNDDVKWIRSD